MIEPKLEITNFINPLINAFSALSNEWKHVMDIGVSEYLYSQSDKYYFTNTFLHRSEKVRFKDIYFPVNAKYNLFTTNFNYNFETFKDYGKIILEGSAGSGKSTLIKHIFLQSIEEKQYIPILIELRNLNSFNGSFENLIFEKVLNTRLKPSVTTFKRSLKKGLYLFLLDGYDEIFSIKKQEINRQIESFVDSYSLNKFIITTRPGGGLEYLPRFYNFDILELSNNEVRGFVNKLIKIQERKVRILAVIEDEKNSNYLAYLRNPLLLSMFILAFESHPEIPDRKSSFYRNVFDTLYSKHDGITKNSFPREKLTKLQRDDFEEILAIFSYLSLIKGKYSFTNEYLSDTLTRVKKPLGLIFNNEDLIHDLRTSISIILLDGFEYTFPHRSLQEYFVAQFLSKLPAEKKQKAYDNLSLILEKSSSDFSFNLWSLCEELDRIAFYTYFSIPQLKLYESNLRSYIKSERIFEINKLLKIAIRYDFISDIEEEVLSEESHYIGRKILLTYRESNTFNALTSFHHVHDFSDIYYFFDDSKAHLELAQLFPDEFVKEKVHRGFGYLPEVMSVMIKYGFLKTVNNLRNSITNKITELENEINQQAIDIDELLNI